MLQALLNLGAQEYGAQEYSFNAAVSVNSKTQERLDFFEFRSEENC